MGLTNYPYGVSSFGAPMVPGGAPLAGFNGPGTASAPGSNVFFVNSATKLAADAAGSNGKDPTRPFKSLNYALTQTVSNNGDVIYVGPQHVETVSAAAGLTFPTATAHGVTVVFQGNETDRAQINYTTSTAATVTIPANNVKIIGARIVNAIDARVDGLVITGSDCTLIDCEFVDGTGLSSLISIRTTSAANRLRLNKIRCQFSENTGTQRTEFIRIVGGNDHELVNLTNDPAGDFSTAFLNNVTTAATGVVIDSCSMFNAHAAVAAAFVSTSIVSVFRSLFQSAGASVITFPTTAGNMIVDNASEMVAGSHSSGIGPGALIAFQKSVTSSTITTSAANFITCTGGSIIIEGGAVETDATGLAGMTNFVLGTDDANGIGTLFSQAITVLGANKSVALSAGATTPLVAGTVLESSKHIQVSGTVSAGTGAGKAYVTIYGRVLSGAPVLS